MPLKQPLLTAGKSTTIYQKAKVLRHYTGTALKRRPPTTVILYLSAKVGYDKGIILKKETRYEREEI